MSVGLIPFVRYGILVLLGMQSANLQSLIVGTVLLIMAFLSVMLGIVSDLIRTNRVLIEDTLEHTKRMRFGNPHSGPPQSSVQSDTERPGSVEQLPSGPEQLRAAVTAL